MKANSHYPGKLVFTSSYWSAGRCAAHKSFMGFLARLYDARDPMSCAGPGRPAEDYSLYEHISYLPALLVDATQATEPATIATDLGFANVHRGDWVVRGEDGECYVVDDAFFQRTFVPIQKYPWEQTEETRSYGC